MNNRLVRWETLLRCWISTDRDSIIVAESDFESNLQIYCFLNSRQQIVSSRFMFWNGREQCSLFLDIPLEAGRSIHADEWGVGGEAGLRLREQQTRTKRMDSKWNYWLKSYCHLVSAKMPTGAVPGADRAYETVWWWVLGGWVGSRNIVCTWTKKGWLQTQWRSCSCSAKGQRAPRLWEKKHTKKKKHVGWV